MLFPDYNGGASGAAVKIGLKILNTMDYWLLEIKTYLDRFHFFATYVVNSLGSQIEVILSNLNLKRRFWRIPCKVQMLFSIAKIKQLQKHKLEKLRSCFPLIIKFR